MTPIKFIGCNIIMGEHQPEYQPLPAFIEVGTPQRPVVTCWEMSEEERKIFLETGKIYLTQLTFGEMLQPVLLSIQNPVYSPQNN
jgi:hypothetical protein